MVSTELRTPGSLTRAYRAIPFVAQPAHPRDRMCGAAALAMVYRRWHPSGERDDAQLCRNIWSRISVADGRGGRYALCHRLAADLCHAGISASALQAADPWKPLLAAHHAGFATVINFRGSEGSPLGHFAVMTDIDAERIELHDPQHGPYRTIPREQFIALWQPLGEPSEIAGLGFMVAAAPSRECHASACPWSSIECPGCSQQFPIAANRALLAAVAGAFCPWCDRGWKLQIT